jgi:hypothetical protein
VRGAKEKKGEKKYFSKGRIAWSDGYLLIILKITRPRENKGAE